jgi:hypothetical protein
VGCLELLISSTGIQRNGLRVRRPSKNLGTQTLQVVIATGEVSIDPNDPKIIFREHREAYMSKVFRARREYKTLYSLVNEQLEIDINRGFETYYTSSRVRAFFSSSLHLNSNEVAMLN